MSAACVSSRRSRSRQLHSALLLIAALLLASCRLAHATLRSDMLIGYSEKTEDTEAGDCEDKLDEQICEGYKESGMCKTGAEHHAACAHVLHDHRLVWDRR